MYVRLLAIVSVLNEPYMRPYSKPVGIFRFLILHLFFNCIVLHCQEFFNTFSTCFP